MSRSELFRRGSGNVEQRGATFVAPDDGAERSGRTDPPEDHAGDPDDARGMRRMDARAMG